MRHRRSLKEDKKYWRYDDWDIQWNKKNSRILSKLSMLQNNVRLLVLTNHLSLNQQQWESGETDDPHCENRICKQLCYAENLRHLFTECEDGEKERKQMIETQIEMFELLKQWLFRMASHLHVSIPASTAKAGEPALV